MSENDTSHATVNQTVHSITIFVHKCTAMSGIVTQKAKTIYINAGITICQLCNACTNLTNSFQILTLSLFVSRIFADYSYSSFSFDDFAFFANRFYWWSYFHRNLSFHKSPFDILA